MNRWLHQVAFRNRRAPNRMAYEKKKEEKKISRHWYSCVSVACTGDVRKEEKNNCCIDELKKKTE